MDHCDDCGKPGPLFTRLAVLGNESVCFVLCSDCRTQNDLDILRRVQLWEPPFDRALVA